MISDSGELEAEFQIGEHPLGLVACHSDSLSVDTDSFAASVADGSVLPRSIGQWLYPWYPVFFQAHLFRYWHQFETWVHYEMYESTGIQPSIYQQDVHQLPDIIHLQAARQDGRLVTLDGWCPWPGTHASVQEDLRPGLVLLAINEIPLVIGVSRYEARNSKMWDGRIVHKGMSSQSPYKSI